MEILVLNLGSSSIKFKLFDMRENKPLASGLAEKIGEEMWWNTLHNALIKV
ncbi:hypothetical protein HpHNI37_11910 [Helicobacter pylori]